jgi:hypothetical protein
VRERAEIAVVPTGSLLQNYSSQPREHSTNTNKGISKCNKVADAFVGADWIVDQKLSTLNPNSTKALVSPFTKRSTGSVS